MKRAHPIEILGLAALLTAGCGDDAAVPGFVSVGSPTDASVTLGDVAGSTGADDSTGAEPEDSTGEAAADERDLFIRGLGYLPLAESELKHQIECPDPDPMACPVNGVEDGLQCEYVHYREAGQYDEFIAFAPNSAALWPGVVLRGQDAEEGLLTPVSLPRAPLKFSVSLPTLGGDPVGEMAQPSLSEFRQQLQQILQQGVNGKTPAQIAYEMTQVTEASQISLALGGSVSWPGGNKVSNMFDFSQENKSNKILVNFTQAYYTIDVDIPFAPADLFTDEVTVDDLARFMDAESPPVYLQSLTYGRRALFAIETTSSVEQVRDALDATYNGLVVEGSLDIDVQHKQVLDSSKISALVLGGSGASATKAVGGFEGLIAYIQEGGDFSLESPGAPIAYKLAYLDNTVTRFAFTSEYASRSCVDTDADLHAELVSLEYIGGNDEDAHETLEVYGNIKVSVPVEGGLGGCEEEGNHWLTLFDRGGEAPVSVQPFGPWQPPAPLFADAYAVPIAAASTLCFKARLYERDYGWFSDNDDFGEHVLGPIAFENGWSGDHIVQLVAEGGEMHATVRVTLK